VGKADRTVAPNATDIGPAMLEGIDEARERRGINRIAAVDDTGNSAHLSLQ
jgi:hypothetical protein